MYNSISTATPTCSDMFDQRIEFSVKMITYIPDIQIRPHPCGLHCTLFIVCHNAVNINCLILHGHVRGVPNLITDCTTAVATPSASFSLDPSLIVSSLLTEYQRSIVERTNTINQSHDTINTHFKIIYFYSGLEIRVP